jgi:hypothetical protein
MGGKKFRFRELGEGENRSGIVKILNEQDQVVLLLNSHCYARFLDDGRALMWWDEGDKNSRHITFSAFRFDELPPISDPAVAAARMKADDSKSTPIAAAVTRSFECFLEAGKHPIEAPPEWSDFEETLVLSDHAPGGSPSGEAHRALFAFDWIGGQVTVHPLDWFNKGNYDFGYQWVARIARTESNTFVGEGIRMGMFELDESGREVKRWLSQDPFHMLQ